MLTESLILLSSLAFLLFVLPLSGAGAFAVELQPSPGFAAQQDVPEWIRARFSDAVLALQRSDLQRALALQQEVIAWLQKNLEANHYFRATSLAVLAKIQVMADQPKAALASTQSAIAIFRTLPSSTNGMQTQLAAVLQLQGMLEAQQGELNAALASTDESVSLLKSLLPGDPSVRSSLIASLMNRGAMHSAMANSAEAIRSSEEALAILRELAQQYPEQRVRLAILLRNLSIMAQDLGRMKTALSYGQESASILLSLMKTQPDLKSSLSRSQEQVESVKGEMLPVGAPAHVPPLVTAFIAQLRSGAIQAAVDSLMQPIYESNRDKLNSLPADEAKKTLSGMDFLRELVLSNLQSDINRNGSARSVEVIRSLRQPDGLLHIHLKTSYAQTAVYTILFLQPSEAGILLREFRTSDHDLRDE